jgi:acetylornithine deacetylase/succinyl-diaminopimelate desuccinylase-like protein
MRRRPLLAALALAAALTLPGSPPARADSPAGAARRYRQAHERAIVDEFIALLSIPNVAHRLADMRRNAAHITRMFEQRGVQTRLLEVEGAPPVVYGELRVPGARQTILFYAHYDGQPVDPSQWAGRAPFRPTLRDRALDDGGKPIPLPAPGRRFGPEWRLYARSAGDDKAPIVAWLTALDALRAARIPLRSNIKFFLDGEEEAGSPHLERILRRHRDLVGADVWIFCDGPVHQNRKQQIAFGARGTTGLQLTIYGAKRELHSGHYGNWAPNPAAMLANLIASMRDDDASSCSRAPREAASGSRSSSISRRSTCAACPAPRSARGRATSSPARPPRRSSCAWSRA